MKLKIPRRRSNPDLARVAQAIAATERELEAQEAELNAAREHEHEVRDLAVRVRLGELTQVEHDAATRQAEERVQNAIRACETAREALTGLRALWTEVARETGAEDESKAQAQVAHARQAEYEARVALARAVRERETAEAAVERERNRTRKLTVRYDPEAQAALEGARRAGSERRAWAVKQIVLGGAPRPLVLQQLRPDERAQVEQRADELIAEREATARERAIRSAEIHGHGLAIDGEQILQPRFE